MTDGRTKRDLSSCLCQTELVCNVCHQALKNLGAQMERVLLSDRNPKVTMDGIRSFNVDLKHCQSEWNKGLFCELSSTVVCLLTVPTAVLWCNLCSISSPEFLMSTVTTYSYLKDTDAATVFVPLVQVGTGDRDRILPSHSQSHSLPSPSLWTCSSLKSGQTSLLSTLTSVRDIAMCPPRWFTVYFIGR